MTDADSTHFLVTYRDPKDGEIKELRARKILDSSLGLSFVALSDFIFETSPLLVQPHQDDLKRRFEAVKTFHLSIYSVVSIEEVGDDHAGLRFDHDRSNLVVLPKSDAKP
jgi:hypothetical protein